MRKNLLKTLALCLCATSTFSIAGCSSNLGLGGNKSNVLRVASWDEYIDMAGEIYEGNDPDLVAFREFYEDLFGIDLRDSRPLYEEFEDWYYKEYGKDIEVEYVALQDNETMYNKIKMGDSYDLLCPSEYMAMKLQAEERLIPFSEDFYDAKKDENNNYYVANESIYTKEIFEKTGLTGYIAGYMWGSTGFVFNPEEIGDSPEEAREIMSSWYCLTSDECDRKITAKDNVRDSYFMGLGMYYEDELLALQENNPDEYARVLSEWMNDTSVATMSGVKKELIKARKNLYGLETDEGKTDMIMGRLDASYQWSGDAVFIIDEAELESDLLLEYSIPKSASNLWFDGWVMMEGAKTEMAEAFVNFLSMPQNVIRNMYYIGYTSCMASSEIYDYVSYSYSAEEGETDKTEYDLSYFFGPDVPTLSVPIEQTRRQLFAQYPDKDTIKRLVVMNYFDKETNERANRMWNNIK